MTVRLVLGVVLIAAHSGASTVGEAETLGGQAVRGSFLSRGFTARAAGMGQAFVAVADDVSALSDNPGGLGRVDALGASATYEAAGEGMGLSCLAVAMPLGPGTAGLGLTALSYGSYDVRDATGQLSGSKALMDMGISLAYGLRNPGWLGGRGWSGFSVEVASEAAGGSMVGIGAGTIIPVGDALALGCAIRHLGPKSGGYGGPAEAVAGLAYLARPDLRISMEGGYALALKEPIAAGGIEWMPVPAAAARVGYRWHGKDQQLGEGLAGMTAGLGARFGRFGVDYAYQPFGDLAASHRLSLVYRGVPAGVREHAGPSPETQAGPGAAAAPPAPVAAPKPTLNVAVGELQAEGVSGSDAKMVTALLHNEIVGTGAFRVVERAETDRVISEQTFQRYGCTTNECAVKLGRLLNVHRMVMGTVGTLFKSYLVTVRVVDVENGEVVFSRVAKGRNQVELTMQLKDLAEEMARQVN